MRPNGSGRGSLCEDGEDVYLHVLSSVFSDLAQMAVT